MTDTDNELFTKEELALLTQLDSMPEDAKSVDRHVNVLQLQLFRHAAAVVRKDAENILPTEDVERIHKTIRLLEGKPNDIQHIKAISEDDLSNDKLKQLMRNFNKG